MKATQQNKFEIVSYNANELPIYIPNEIFNDFKNRIGVSTPSHLAFAYSYYYLSCYLYRYTKYGLGDKFSDREILSYLGYSPSTKKLNYITKKNGILDQMGYTITTNNFPVLWGLDEHELPEFTLYKEFCQNNPELVINPQNKNFKIKFPLKAFHRHDWSIEDRLHDGTFFEADNTHSINVEKFIKIMSNDNLGTTGFYVYGFLVYKCDKHNNSYMTTFDYLNSDIGISVRTLKDYVKELCASGFIKVKNNGKEKPNTYQIC
jgi:hypothetical protein